MYQLNHLEDTIVAISTPVGRGGIGIVRLSGKKTLAICDELFVSKKNKKPSRFKSFTVHYGWAVHKRGGTRVPGRPRRDESSTMAGPPARSSQAINPSVAELTDFEIIDEVLLTIMRAPKSYTKEDVAEISCHGGIVVVKAILERAVELGARLAEPGEFTKRAFLNGRLDLTQAEAVLDIIQAKTDRFLNMSLNQLKGDLTVQLESIREALMQIYVQLEAIVNFPEDDIDPAGRKKMLEDIGSIENHINRLLQSAEHGRILKEGIKIVICGKPNVGKSSLLNVLLRTPRAIVTDVAGTTRDTIEETLQIKGIPFQLIDTAGILKPRDQVEEEAIKRSKLSIENADLILFVLDGNAHIDAGDEALIRVLRDKNILIAVNKSDLPQRISDQNLQDRLGNKKILRISALKRTAIEDLEQAIVENVWKGEIADNPGVCLSNIRHVKILEECRDSVVKAVSISQEGMSAEFISEEIKSAVNFLDSLTGKNIDRDLLDKIFSAFCIGK